MTNRKVLCLYAAVFTCGIILSGCANSGADMKAAKEARLAGDYEKAQAELEPMAAFGLPDAQVELAVILLQNKDASQADLDKARGLLERASTKEYAPAYSYLGRLYARGMGVPKNIKAAEDNYNRAIALGYTRSVNDLAQMYEKEKDYKRAEGLYRQAYGSHYYRAAKNLARLSEKGLGVERDPVVALSWYIAAQRHGIGGLDKKVEDLKNTLGPNKVSQAEALSEGYDVDEKVQ
ncbi:MAG: sel1 repeat family protein [Alphaproteobacteria bacterium]|nr:sel1 repeat family protein [Alphaproteobacteria bacterium]